MFFYKSPSNLSNFRDSFSWPLAPFSLFSLGLHAQSYCVYTIQSNQIISLRVAYPNSKKKVNRMNIKLYL